MHISTTVEGVQVDTLMETGSELSGVSLELFHELTEHPGIDPAKYFPDELGACGITGSAVDSFGFVNLEVKIGPNTFRANFWILRMSPRLLIGRDLLGKQKITIDCGARRVEMPNKVIHLIKDEKDDRNTPDVRLYRALFERHAERKKRNSNTK